MVMDTTIYGKALGMGVIKSAIFTILERFPDRKDAIRRLYCASIGFQTLCEDFCQCDRALAHWTQSARTDAPARKEEYEALQRELENEINRFLDEAESKTVQ
jgi:hypothetical protein